MTAKIHGHDRDRPSVLGGSPAVVPSDGDERLFHWPMVTDEDEQAVLEVLRAGNASGTDITKVFESEYAAWQGSRYALASCNGTAALLASMWACEIGAGTEIICPSMTYWASAAPALTLGATVNFAEVDPATLCLDPDDVEHRINSRTKALVAVNYAGHPADYDRLLPIARRHGIRVIEDNSHAHGALYKGRRCGTFGDIAAASMMFGKSFAVGEGGIITTDDPVLYERCVAFGHYQRTTDEAVHNPVDKRVHDQSLRLFSGLPLGAAKHRMNQMCSAIGRVQLRHYEDRIAEIQKAMNRFWSHLEDVAGLRPHRITEPGSTMGGWYTPTGLYVAEELDGLPVARFCEAVRAEGVSTCWPGVNAPLHTHAFFHHADLFRQGQPTAIAFGQRDVRQGTGSLPVTEQIALRTFKIPWFKHDDPARIEQYAAAYRKVAEQARELAERS